MGRRPLQKNVERTSVTKASPDCERASEDVAPTSRMVAFHQDDQGHWVVELSCGHTQHLRHQPPWQVRPWVLDAERRADCLGQVFACGWCARGADETTLGA
ncbi:DUF3565 domain-containing protein [Pseudomonas monteilii]|uniref:DUF3565 domain-containing protein n=1 Tax=Pseudomonas alabamensis TaxID=3064349 RepID=UPI002712FF79|nr:DUF3565 domain-containing protein [Pseudomonas sp. 22-AL-CL-001]MDO7910304.1 DUF3565 domain-containing protein [Pseudomonas sp. 22-AL-CL-001]